MNDTNRRLEPSETDFIRGADVPAVAVGAIEGAVQGEGLKVKPLMVGAQALFLEVHRAKGLIDPAHDHPDHESLCYLVRGRMRVIIDGEERIAEAGDIWRHRPGIIHYHEALEDCLQIEIKTPAVRTWS